MMQEARSNEQDGATMRRVLVEKLGPGRVQVSPKFRAILGCLLGEVWTEPCIDALCVTSDGILLARHAGDIGFNHVEGVVEDLLRNLEGLAEVAQLTPEEAKALVARVPARGAPA